MSPRKQLTHDDNFASIVSVIEKGGGAVFDDLREFLGCMLSSNIPEIGPHLDAASADALRSIR